MIIIINDDNNNNNKLIMIYCSIIIITIAIIQLEIIIKNSMRTRIKALRDFDYKIFTSIEKKCKNVKT